MDPNPFKHPAVILARIRDAIEPSLAAAGFEFDGRNKPLHPVYIYIDYCRGDELFRLSWDRREDDRFIGFVAEWLREAGEIETVTSLNMSSFADLPRDALMSEIQTQIDTLATSVKNCLLAEPD